MTNSTFDPRKLYYAESRRTGNCTVIRALSVDVVRNSDQDLCRIGEATMDDVDHFLMMGGYVREIDA